MTIQLLIAVACLMGAAGVVLAAAGAHSMPGAGLDSAAHMLLFHASAVIAGTLASGSGLMLRPVGLAGCAGLVVGALLFSGDIALRAYTGHRLFPMAAPAGGIVLIGSWIVLAASALAASAGRT